MQVTKWFGSVVSLALVLVSACGEPDTTPVPRDAGGATAPDGGAGELIPEPPVGVTYDIPSLGPVPPQVCLELWGGDVFWYRTRDDAEYTTIPRGERRLVPTDGPTIEISHLHERSAVLRRGIPVHLLDCEPEPTSPPEYSQIPYEVGGAGAGLVPVFRMYADWPVYAFDTPLRTVEVVLGEPFWVLAFDSAEGVGPGPNSRILARQDVVTTPDRTLHYDLTSADASDLRSIPVVGTLRAAIPELRWAWTIAEPSNFAGSGWRSDGSVRVPTRPLPELYVTVDAVGTQWSRGVDLEVWAVRSMRATQVGDAIDLGLDGVLAPELRIEPTADGGVQVSVHDASPAPGLGTYYRMHCAVLEQAQTGTSFTLCQWGQPITNVDVGEWVPDMRAEYPIAYSLITATTSRLRDYYNSIEGPWAGFLPPVDGDAVHHVSVSRSGEWRPL